jgi:hypothetical protein
MEVTDGGYIWVEEPVSIGIELITYITGLPPRGETPAQFVNDKTKEKAVAEKMKKMYGTKRGSRRIIIKRISDATTRMTKQIRACKLLRKFHKEEFPVRVIAATSQCAEGTILSWALYLLNLFLEDCKDVQDLGKTFHYSWLLVLISLVIWRETKYTYFAERYNRCRAT